MYQNNDLYQYLHQVQQNMSSQCKKINALENQLKDIQAELIKLKKDKALHVEKIEYNFDQLKIETLEGTLNIGITPSGIDSIEEFEIENDNSLHLTNSIQKQMDNYFNEEVFNDISTIENKYNYFLTDEYKKFVINDVKKQINKQISIYVQNSKSQISDKNIDTLEKEILKKVVSDVNKAVETFVVKLPREENIK